MKKGTTVVKIKPTKKGYVITKVKGDKKLFGINSLFGQEMHLPNQQMSPFV